MEKSTTKRMVIFNSYVKLPEGTFLYVFFFPGVGKQVFPDGKCRKTM